MRLLILTALIVTLSGCKLTDIGLSKTLGEKSSGHGYIPLDGLAVDQRFGADSCKNRTNSNESPSSTSNESPPSINNQSESATKCCEQATEGSSSTNCCNQVEREFLPLLESLPDISVRFAVASFDTNGGLNFGPVKVTKKDKNYRAILDYVNVDTIPVRFWVTAYNKTGAVELSTAVEGLTADYYEVQLYNEEAHCKERSICEKSTDSTSKVEHRRLVSIPVYVGIGMRLSADITAQKNDIAITSLGSLGLEAAAKNITGTLAVQTIGISGLSIATALPLPSSLDQTTIENGILAIGSSRAIVYRSGSEDGKRGIYTTPRVVGLYSPIGSDPKLINEIYSELVGKRPVWHRPCKPLDKNRAGTDGEAGKAG